VRQPCKHAWMKTLGSNKTLIQFRFEPVQEFPGQGYVGSRVGGLARCKAFRLVFGEHVNFRRGVAPAQLETTSGSRIRWDHRLRPSSCRSPTTAPTATFRRGALSESAPRTQRLGSLQSGCALPTMEHSYSGSGWSARLRAGPSRWSARRRPWPALSLTRLSPGFAAAAGTLSSMREREVPPAYGRPSRERLDGLEGGGDVPGRRRRAPRR
jgi:hypothetical protein